MASFFLLPGLNLIFDFSFLERVNLLVSEKSFSLGDILVEHFIAYGGKLVELIAGRKIIYPFLLHLFYFGIWLRF